MCGIIGYVGPDRAVPILIHGLRRLEYRGYDSAGLAIWKGDHIVGVHACKSTESIDVLEDEASGHDGSIGLAHTRWTQHGAASKENAHPHFDTDRKIAVVHNGTIENYLELKAELKSQGVKFRSETDTEVIPHLLARLRYERPDMAFLDVLRLTLGRLRGTYGLVIFHDQEPDRLYAARHSASMVIGVAKDATFVASEAIAFTRYTREVTELEDGEIAVITAGDFQIHNANMMPVARATSTFEWSDEEAQKGGHPHFMLKEMYEQPDTLRNVLRGRLDHENGNARLGGLLSVTERLKSIERIVIVGCGTAYHAGLYGKRVIESLARIPVEVDLSHEFIYRDALIDDKTALIAVSQSGTTLETEFAVIEAKRKGALTLGIVNKVGTPIPRATHAGVYCHAGPEIGVASTKAFVAQAAIFALIALYLGRMRHISLSEGRELVAALDKLPSLAEQALKQANILEEWAKANAKSVGTMILGRGSHVPIALEGALKLLEVGYVHAHGHAAAEMKHGPLAIVEPGYPCIMLCPLDELHEKNLGTLSELQARGAKIMAITDEAHHGEVPKASETIRMPTAHRLLQPIISVIPLQLYAYHVSVARGINPDKPRNLAKSVTVE
jgi:glucosamine--fructose-6-phosphate aminotransferase (isomerizing)